MGGGSGKFLRSFYIVGRGVLTLLFYEDLPPILPTPIPFFFQILSNPYPTVLWSNGVVVPGSKVWLKGRLSFSSVRG